MNIENISKNIRWITYFKASILLVLLVSIVSCETETPVDCVVEKELDDSRGACNETLVFTPQVTISDDGSNRIIASNNIPQHKVGKFGKGKGSLNPNKITEQEEVYYVPLNPQENKIYTALLSINGAGPNAGPQYSFGVLLNGVELDPIAAEPFPHQGMMNANVNWEWNLEALNVDLGLDCNNAHVQPTGKYHYHGQPTLYLQNANIPNNAMTLIGYAADGFPIYYKYAFEESYDANSDIVEMTSSYTLKSGMRPGDGNSAPCGDYDGVYSNDYEYQAELGTLDEANGRKGVTPEFPDGTYYYVLTDEFPSIPRYFRGSPSDDFKIGK